MSRRILIPLAAVAILAAGAFYYIFDPETARFMPQCLFNRLTGLQCPGCGSQRMLHALLHLRPAEAFRANPVALMLLPYLMLLLCVEVRRNKTPRLYAALASPTAIAVILLILLAWAILRNL